MTNRILTAALNGGAALTIALAAILGMTALYFTRTLAPPATAPCATAHGTAPSGTSYIQGRSVRVCSDGLWVVQTP
jgi:hypothetical protein